MFWIQCSITKIHCVMFSFHHLLRADMKKYWKNILCENSCSKRVRNCRFWEYFTIMSTKSTKKKIPSKIYIYIKYICLTIKIWLKICKIMAFKNWQQESTKGTLRLENKLFSFNFKLILKFAPLLLFIAHLLKQLKILIHFLII